MFLFFFVIRFRFGCPHTKSSVHINNVGFVCQRLQCTNFQFSNCQTHFEFYAIRRIHSLQYFHFVQQILYLFSRISHSPINNIYNIDTSTLPMKERKNLYPFRMLIKIWATNQSKDRFFLHVCHISKPNWQKMDWMARTKKIPNSQWMTKIMNSWLLLLWFVRRVITNLSK